MIKTGRVEGKETGTLEMSGTLNDLMNDYNVIAKGMRKILVEKLNHLVFDFHKHNEVHIS